MLEKLNATAADRLHALFEEHIGPAAVAALGDHDKIWSVGNRFDKRNPPGRGNELDSLDKVEFFMALEDEFGVTVTDDQAEEANTRRAIAELIGTLLDEKDQTP